MARYGLIWLEIAREDYGSLPEAIRVQISTRIEQLLENPRRPADGYDEPTDQWTATYGDGAGLIVYAVVHERQRVIILRLVWSWWGGPASIASRFRAREVRVPTR
jgi:mRNA-degrading endonuclease RelE of RelBE toxin-antitoxin system